jgi:DAACS family dicarboxylate/amino acid:cation (Na+ or H+) symporter
MAGAISPTVAQAAGWLADQVFTPAGQVFLRLLMFVVVPLVFASLALGVVQLGGLTSLGRLAGRTFFVFGLNMAVGVALGLLVMNTVRPGDQLDPATRAELVARYAEPAAQVGARAVTQPGLSLRSLVDMFLPANMLRAVVDFQILPLILFALLVGVAGLQLPEARRTRLRELLEVVADLMTAIVHFTMRLAPYAVAALLAGILIRAGLDILRSLLLFVVCVLGAMAIHLFGTMSLLLRLFTRLSPIQFFKSIRTILVTAFSTSSSNATLPTTIEVSREKLGVSAGTAGFVLPLGATLNMSGTALYEGCVVLFIAQVYGVPLSLSSQALLLGLAVLSAVAVAGIPGASLPLIVGLLITFGLPAEGIALIYGADRLLDMARTTLNVAADVVTAVIVDARQPESSP